MQRGASKQGVWHRAGAMENAGERSRHALVQGFGNGAYGFAETVSCFICAESKTANCRFLFIFRGFGSGGGF